MLFDNMIVYNLIKLPQMVVFHGNIMGISWEYHDLASGVIKLGLLENHVQMRVQMCQMDQNWLHALNLSWMVCYATRRGFARTCSRGGYKNTRSQDRFPQEKYGRSSCNMALGNS